jgi:succinate dehydrogenase / fumarate reductase cytochrome b subunit
VASSASQPSISSNLPGGVPPLRAGEGYSFLLRRLHSLSGIFPIGAYVLEHMISNAYANRGANAYSQQVHFLTSLPFVPALEIFFIFIPLAYHAGYGLVIWWGGEAKRGSTLSLGRKLALRHPAVDGNHCARLYRVSHLEHAF